MPSHENEIMVAPLGAVKDWKFIVGGLVPSRYAASHASGKFAAHTFSVPLAHDRNTNVLRCLQCTSPDWRFRRRNEMKCLIAVLLLLPPVAAAQQYGWQIASRPSTLACGPIEFVDSLNGWTNFTLESPARVYRTRDGGYTWTSSILPAATNGLTGISFVDTLHGWGVSMDGHIFATTNGGQSWTLQYYPQLRQYRDNASLTSEKALAVGSRTVSPDTGYVSKTANAGSTWTDHTLQTVTGIGSIDFADTLNGWAQPNGNRILRSRDGGGSWSIVPTPVNLARLTFPDTLHGWGLFFSGGAYWVLRTNDGGVSWDTVLVRSGSVILEDVKFADPSNGWVFADTLFASLVYHTTNGGVSWTKEAFNLTSGLSLGTATDRFHAWVGSDNGTILKYGLLTGVPEQPSPVPKEFTLSQNYPNPFNPTTSIKYFIPKQTHVLLVVIDVLGKRICELVNAAQSPGSYTVQFDGTGLASGVYFYQLKTSEYQETKQMTLAR